VIVRPLIDSLSKTATSCSVGIISSCLKCNVFVSRFNHSISAWTKPWSSLSWSRQLTYKNPVWNTYGWTHKYSIIRLCVRQSTTIPRFVFFIANNNLSKFSKHSSCKQKRCSSTFCFTTHVLSYDILYL